MRNLTNTHIYTFIVPTNKSFGLKKFQWIRLLNFQPKNKNKTRIAYDSHVFT